MDLMDAKRRRSTELKATKNKIPIASKTVAQMLQQKKITKPNASDNSNEIEEIEINDSDSNEAVVSTSVRDVIDSVAKGEEANKETLPKNGEDKNTSNCSSDGDDLNRKDSTGVVKLPDNLPEDLALLIDKIKKVFLLTVLKSMLIVLICGTVGADIARRKTQFL